MLQALSRSALLESVRGPRGGYRLGRPGRDITIAHIVEVATADDAGGEDGPKGELFARVVEPAWDELDGQLRQTLQARLLDDLVRAAEKSGLKRPLAEPISFSI